MVIAAITAGLRDGTAAQPRRRGMESLREGFRFIADTSAFRGLAITRVLIGIGVAVFEYHMLASASHAYPSAETLQAFYATLEMAVTALVLLLVWAGVRRMNARLEFDLLFALMPAALVGALLSSLVWSSLGSAVVGYGLMRVTQRAVDEPARKAFNSAVSEAVRGRINALLDGCYPLGWTLGAAVVGLVLLGTERGALAAELGPGLYLGAAVGSAGAALWLILRSRASYREASVATLQAPP
jgi:Na+/phosphate symporter